MLDSDTAASSCLVELLNSTSGSFMLAIWKKFLELVCGGDKVFAVKFNNYAPRGWAFPSSV